MNNGSCLEKNNSEVYFQICFSCECCKNNYPAVCVEWKCIFHEHRILYVCLREIHVHFRREGKRGFLDSDLTTRQVTNEEMVYFTMQQDFVMYHRRKMCYMIFLFQREMCQNFAKLPQSRSSGWGWHSFVPRPVWVWKGSLFSVRAGGLVKGGRNGGELLRPVQTQLKP